MDEKYLLTELRHGNREAFEKLYFNYAERLMGKLLLLVKSEELAKDLLQDIFLKIWQIRADIDPERSFAALLYRMSTNLSYNSFRSVVREGQKLMDVFNEEGYFHIEEDVSFREVSGLLDQALEELTDRQRSIYVLHKLEGKSYKEISEMLQISHSAINQHLQQANKQVRLFMRSHLPEILIAVLSFWLRD